MALREILAHFEFKIDKRSQAKAQDSIQTLTRAMGVLGAIFVTGRAAQGFKALLDQASAAKENINVMTQVFGDLTDETIAWADATAKHVGRSKFQMQAFIGTLGAILRPMLGTNKAAAEMSKNLSKTAIDIASLYEVDDERALQAIRSGMVGQVKPLQALGINLTQASIKQDQMTLGIKGQFQSLTNLQKSQIRYAAIMRQSAAATDDAHRTISFYRNATKRLDGMITEFTTNLGLKLIPTAEKFLNGFLIPMAAQLDKAVIPVFRTFMAIVRLATTPLGVISVAVLLLGVGFQILGASATFALIRLGILAAGFLFVGAAILLIIDDLEAMGAGHKSVINDMIIETQLLIDKNGGIGGAIGDAIDVAIRHWARWLGYTDQETNDLITNLEKTFETFAMNIVESIGQGIKNVSEWIFDMVVKIFDKISGLGFVLRKITALAGLVFDAAAEEKVNKAAAKRRVEEQTRSGAGLSSQPEGTNFSPNTEVNVTVNTNSSQPEAIGNAVGGATTSAVDGALRTPANAFVTERR